MGGAKMPTVDSKNTAHVLDRAAKGKAEVGPAPSLGALNSTNQNTLQSQAVKMPSSAGSLPKLGSAIENDPLVQYIKKHAEQLATNVDEMELGGCDIELQSEPSDFRDTDIVQKKKEEDALLKNLFTHFPNESAHHE
jgi:hypothetical protein